MQYYSIDRRAFYRVTRCLHRAASRDTARPQLRQVSVCRKDNVITMAVTDGHRVHRMHHHDRGKAFEFGIPLSYVDLLCANRNILGGHIVIEDSDSSSLQLRAYSHTHTYTVTNLVYDFPPVEMTIPNAYYVKDTIDVKAFRKVLRDVIKAIPSSDNYRLVKIISRLEEPSILTFTAFGEEVGAINVLDRKADSDADPIAMGINLNYLVDLMQPLKCETVDIKWLGARDPLVITSDRQDVTKGLAWYFDSVVMPVGV